MYFKEFFLMARVWWFSIMSPKSCIFLVLIFMYQIFLKCEEGFRFTYFGNNVKLLYQILLTFLFETNTYLQTINKKKFFVHTGYIITLPLWSAFIALISLSQCLDYCSFTKLVIFSKKKSVNFNFHFYFKIDYHVLGLSLHFQSQRVHF